MASYILFLELNNYVYFRMPNGNPRLFNCRVGSLFETPRGINEPGVLSLLSNPKKNIKYEFSHPETLIINK